MRTCFLTLGWPFLGPLLFSDKRRPISLKYTQATRASDWPWLRKDVAALHRLRGKPENGNSATAQGEDHRPRCSPNSLWLPLIVSITGRFSLRRANSSRQRVV
jgi:hypothetical protein